MQIYTFQLATQLTSNYLQFAPPMHIFTPLSSESLNSQFT